MKLKLIALLLALTAMSWAQSTTPGQAPTPEQKNSTPADAKGSCPRCDQMAPADHKDGKACMHHGAAGKDEKEAMSCCSGKDAKGASSCCAGRDGRSCSKDDKATAACCGGGKCGEGHEMACWSHEGGKKAANDCCAGLQCGKHDHHDHATPGN
jgi:hypothetical protein